MIMLSHRQVQVLLDLLENTLLQMSRDGDEDCTSYAELQKCRYSLLEGASANSCLNNLVRAETSAAKNRDYLRVIEGDKP